MFFDILSGIKIEIWVLFCSVLWVYHLVKGWLVDKKRNLPPGPIGVPVFGYIPFLSRDVHFKFTKLSRKYGEVFSLRLGSKLVVVLNGTDSIKEAFDKNEFLGRPESSAFSLLASKSPFFQNRIQLWKGQRRFVIQSIKDLGLRKSKIEENVQDELRHFHRLLHSEDPLDLTSPLTSSVSNNICSLVLGARYDYGHPEKLLLDDSLEQVTRVIGQTAFHIFFPWMRHFMFLFRWLVYEKGVVASNRSDELFMSKVQEHKKTLDPNNVRDFIDNYLIEIERRRAKDPNTPFTEITLVGCAGDMFGAGSETVRTSISWCIYVVAAFPEAQKRIHREIWDVLGCDRFPELKDMKDMPFTHAVILEVLRWKTIVPINILRYTLEDTSVSGYDVPRGTIVMGNFWAVHHNPDYWGDPHDFRPERFLSADKKSVVKPPSYMPFSVGKRACPGERIAYMEIFLYLTSILQKYDLKFPDGVLPTFEAEFTISYKLKPYRIRLLPRN